MTRKEELKIIEDLIKSLYPVAKCGLFSTRNIVGDRMETIFEGEFFTLDMCYGYSYFEVFGTTDEEFRELEKFYDKL